ncbi:MAG: RecX family transcriptional regulator [Clostridia bacterium]|nr:RecX family transcriptional regulator [Clostridia bacterium]
MFSEITYLTKGDQLGETVCRIEIRQTPTDPHFEEKILHVLPYTESFSSLKRGPLTEDEFEQLTYADEVWRAVVSGLYSLKYGSNTVNGLIRKLRRKGFSPNASKDGVAFLKDKGFIREDEEVCRQVELYLNQNKSAKEILGKLYQKGYSDESIRTAKEMLQDVDFDDVCYQSWIAHFGKDVPEGDLLRKNVAKMARNGFTYAQIQACLERLSND